MLVDSLSLHFLWTQPHKHIIDVYFDGTQFDENTEIRFHRVNGNRLPSIQNPSHSYFIKAVPTEPEEEPVVLMEGANSITIPLPANPRKRNRNAFYEEDRSHNEGPARKRRRRVYTLTFI